MLPHLIRKAFLDRPWGPADLDAAAEFWLRLYEAAARANGFSRDPSHGVEVRLRGFPRDQADALRAELGHRVEGTDFPVLEVDQPDPDTLVLRSRRLSGGDAPPAGLGLPLLAGPPFDGLLAEVRVGAVGKQGGIFSRGWVRSALVLVGELRGGELVLKAVWRAGPVGWEDDVRWFGEWPQEVGWLSALDRFRESEEVPVGLANRLFPTRRADGLAGATVRLLRVHFGRPRMGWLLSRVLLFAALSAGLGLAAWELVARGQGVWLLPLAVLAGWLGWLVWAFVRDEARFLFGRYAEFRSRYAQQYEEAVKHVPLAPAEAAARLDHPWARKCTADLEAAGFVHAGDLRPDPPVGVASTVRVFRAPDGVTTLNVLFMTTTHPDPAVGLRIWPALVAFLAHTYFPDGGRVQSVAGRYLGGYRKKRTGREHVVRMFPDGTELVDLVRAHAGVVEAVAKETGQAPLRHERFDLYVRRQNDALEEERRLYGEHPYTWGDHLHCYLQVTRREYRE